MADFLKLIEGSNSSSTEPEKRQPVVAPIEKVDCRLPNGFRRDFDTVIDIATHLEAKLQANTESERMRVTLCSMSLALLHLEQAALCLHSENEAIFRNQPKAPTWLLEVINDLSVSLQGRGNIDEAVLLSQLHWKLRTRFRAAYQIQAPQRHELGD